jgi:hypothetical protein
MQRRIVDADNGDFATAGGDKGGLIDQEGDFMAIGKFAVPIDRYATVMIMIAQGDEDRRNFAQAGEKSKHMRQSLWHVEQIAGDKDPVGPELANGGDDEIVPWLITVEVQIAQMNGPSACQDAVCIGES